MKKLLLAVIVLLISVEAFGQCTQEPPRGSWKRDPGGGLSYTFTIVGVWSTEAEAWAAFPAGTFQWEGSRANLNRLPYAYPHGLVTEYSGYIGNNNVGSTQTEYFFYMYCASGDCVPPENCFGCSDPTDTDEDGELDCSDQCPEDPNKIVPGECGCGISDVDRDGDGTPECDDCPDDENKTEPGICGCGTPDTDTDEDSTADCIDECDENPDKIVENECGCSADIVEIKPDKDNLIPGEETIVRSTTKNPANDYLDWSIERVSGNANADITESGRNAVIYNVSGEGYLKIVGENAGCAFEYLIYVGCEGCTGGSCSKIGSSKLRIKSIDASFALGRTSEGRLAGNIMLSADNPDPANATPAALKFNSFNRDSEVIKDGGILRQVVAPETFVDIVTIDPYSYDILFYRLDDLGPKVGDSYEVVSGAIPITAWTIENPDASDTVYNRLRITEDKNGNQKVHEYIWNASENTWSLSKGNGLQVISKKEETLSGNRVVTEIIKDNLGRITSKTKTTWHTFPWGEEIVEEVTDPDNAALTTVTEYYETSGENGYEHIKSQINPDGSWMRYEYDAENRKTAQIRSWLDAPVDSPAESSHAIYYDYTPQDAADSDESEDTVRPRLVTEEIEGNVVSKTYYVYHVDSATNERTEMTKQCTDTSASYNDQTNLTTVQVYYEQGTDLAEEGKIKSIRHPDGRMDSYTYEYGTYAPDAAPALAGSFAPGSGSDVREIVVHGTVSSPEGIGNRTLREISIQNHVGEQLLQESQVYNGSSYEQIQYSTQVYDQDGHVTEVYNSDSTHTETSWGCCNKESETDARGITTLYLDYDDLGRLLTSTKEGVSPYADINTTYTYDAVGRTLTQTVSSGGLSLSSENIYDSAGRLDYTTDAAGLITNYDYASNNRINTITRPGGATEITERYADGRIKSIAGTGIVPRYYSYGVNVDGTQWSRVNTGSAGSAMWEKNTTDMLGRTVRVEKPGYAGMETTEHFYNTVGQLEKTTTTGQADSLYEYDELGNQVRSGLDVDASGTLVEASTDRISDSETLYSFIESNWWQETTTVVYATENVATSTSVGAQRAQISGLGTGGMIGKSVSIDIHGNETLSQVVIDRANKTETRTIDYPDSDIDGVSQTINGLLITSTSKTGITLVYTYDALRRRTNVTDPRTGTSITHYNDKGQVDYVEDAANNRMSFTYEKDSGLKSTETNALNKVTRYLYNLRSQATHTWGDAAYPVMYEYDTYGRLEKMHTYRSGSDWNQALWPIGATGEADTTTWHYQEATGFLTSKEDALGKTVSYTFKEGGKLETRTWARTSGSDPIMTSYIYDPNTAELTNIEYSDTTSDITFTYDRLGRQKTVTDAVGSRTFAYNGSLQLESETITGLVDKVITRTYETSGVIGRSTGFNTGTDYSITYGYETTGRFNTVDWNVGGSTQAAKYTYDPNSDLLYQLTTNNGQQTTYSYDANRNLKTRVKNEHNSQLISQYDYKYDAIGRRSSVANSGQAFAAVVSAFNIYGYNDRNELTESSRYLGTDMTNTANPVTTEYRNYDYDPIGNRTQAVEDTLTQDYTPNAVNQYEQITANNGQSTTDTLTYDEDGNLTAANLAGSERNLTYNAENRLIAIEPQTPADGDKKLEFVYDYMGRRVQKKVFVWQTGHWSPITDHLFFYDGWNLICQTTDDGQQTTEEYFIWGLDLSQSLQGAGGIGGLIASIEPATDEILALDLDGDDDIDGMDANIASADPGHVDLSLFAKYCGRADISSPLVHYYQYDANGNVGQMVNATEDSIVAHYEYDPYGDEIVAKGSNAEYNNFRFSTKFYDTESCLYYYGYRYYSSTLGRWLTRDPLGEDGGVNLYVFLNNSSINTIDPYGLADFMDSHYRFYPELSAAKHKNKESRPCCDGKYYDEEVQCCENNKLVDKDEIIYVINRDPRGDDQQGSMPGSPGSTGGHIDIIVPGSGMVGFYGEQGTGSCGSGMKGYFNKTLSEWSRPPKEGGRPSYIAGPRGGQKNMICEIKVCPSDVGEMNDEISKMGANPPSFNIIGGNCSTRACQITGAGGVKRGGISGIDNPRSFIRQLEKEGAKCYSGVTGMGPQGVGVWKDRPGPWIKPQYYPPVIIQ